MSTEKRLSEVFEAAQEIPFDNSKKFILFSDCHRGDNSWADEFANNQNLFLHALNDYYQKGFTYIEIGDGDDLWENDRFEDIRKAHEDVFTLMQKFYEAKKLYLIWGNHDIERKGRENVEATLHRYYDGRTGRWEPLFEGIQVYEGLILRHTGTGKKVFLVHGHQADPFNDWLWPVNRLVQRYVWRPLQIFGVKDQTCPAKNFRRQIEIEEELKTWAKAHDQMLVAGHTHSPAFPPPGEPLYFNDGSCVHPLWITGIEIQNGRIILVKWRVRVRDDSTLYVDREVLVEGDVASFTT